MIIKISPLFGLFCISVVLIIGISELVPSSYAASYQVEIAYGSGSSQNCVASGNCFFPENLQISVGDTVTWTNQDSVGHTVTSGHPSDTQTGTLFDSSIIASGSTYSLTFNGAGTYNYFDMVHPWLIGTITVQNANYNNSPQQLSCPKGYFLVNNLCYQYLYPTLTLQTPQVNGLSVTFDGAAQARSYGSTINKIVWDWGDGQSTIGNFPQIHTYAQSGTYAVKVSTYDNYGYGHWESYSVSVQSYQSPPSTTSDQIPQWVRNDAIWWGNDQIDDATFSQAVQYLINNNIISVSTSQSQTNSLGSALQGILAQVHYHGSRPMTIIHNDTVNWIFSDSKGNKYHWSMPLATYDTLVQKPINISPWYLKLPNGQTVTTYDYKQFVNTIMANPNFVNVVDQLYDNAGSDEQFIYETWYVVSEMTTYNKDMTNSNLWPLEVFTRGTGDCKDKSILIADMLRSSSHTRNWSINLEVMDANNPSNPQAVNHMIVMVNTGQNSYAVESTATPDNNGLNVWAGKEIYGWQIPA